MFHRRRYSFLVFMVLVGLLMAWRWSHMINAMMPADSRPRAVSLPGEILDKEGFELVAAELTRDFPDTEFNHILYFRAAGITGYEGPATCLQCHEKIQIEKSDGQTVSVDLMDNLTDSAHYRFFSKAHPNVWGFNGKLADNFPMGKVNRPCPKPGSFAMTAWAEIVVTQAGDTLSEGCGQCHIGGQPQAPLGEMMPLYQTLDVEKDAIDCLICHSTTYDMNRKQVVLDDDGRSRWAQDRTLKSALAVNSPTAPTCLRCHQHNMGGDIFIDENHPEYHQSLINTGSKRPRVRHPGSKRGTPYSPEWDVHAAAGVECIECHRTEGHLMAKGTHTTTMMANDRPLEEISCLDCHDDPPHDEEFDYGVSLNEHIDKLACQTCHIPYLHPDNMTKRDFAHTEYEDHEGIYIYEDPLKLNKPGEGIAYVWWNGDCSFLGNPIGDNPNNAGLYTFYDAKQVWPEFADFDYAGWYEEVMRPIARQGRPSKIYPMKRFNGRQHIDLQNIGPFGGMFVPYNLPSYYRDGDPDASARKEMEKSMMGMMYGWMFKFYMLDKFMSFMSIDGWNTGSYEDVKAGRNVQPRYLPTDAMLEISHSIRLEGALDCSDCHAEDGVMDWEMLGYTEDEIMDLSEER